MELLVSNHGTILREGTKCKKIFLSKSIQFGIPLKQSTTCFKQKTEIFLVTRHQLAEKFDSCFQFLRKDKKGIKENLLLNLQQLHLRLFSYKNVSQIPCHIFAVQSFFTDHLKHKTIIKTTAELPQQILADYLHIS